MTRPFLCCWCPGEVRATVAGLEKGEPSRSLAACREHASGLEVYGVPVVPLGQLRRVCAWGDPPHPMDGAGPVPPGAVVSHGICPLHLSAFVATPDDADPDGGYLEASAGDSSVYCPRFLAGPPAPCRLFRGHAGPCSRTAPQASRPRFRETA